MEEASRGEAFWWLSAFFFLSGWNMINMIMNSVDQVSPMTETLRPLFDRQWHPNYSPKY
jgi:hypothetical protein